MNSLTALTPAEQRKIAVWVRCATIPNYDPTRWRYDFQGYVIHYHEYGDRQSVYGWEIDHIVPALVGGSDDISNLRARHWFPNASAGGALGSVAGANALGGLGALGAFYLNQKG